MGSGGEETGITPFQEFPSSNFGILDLMDDETNLDQLIDLIREENESNPILNFTSQIFDFDNQNRDSGCLAEKQLFSLENDQLFEFNDDVSMNTVGGISRDCSTENEFPNDVVEEEREEEESSATTSEKKQKKIDRSRTLISERRRRGRMKEKLYALRSLVPNITKVCLFVFFSSRS